MASSNSQIDKPQRGCPKRAELPDVNINTGVQSINTESFFKWTRPTSPPPLPSSITLIETRYLSENQVKTWLVVTKSQKAILAILQQPLTEGFHNHGSHIAGENQ